jgi:uncharacterized protein YbjT (DUF2867 family)
MDLLILGGTGFLGRYLVEAALADGHRPTLFNRGLSGPGLFPEIEKLEGDRDGTSRPIPGGEGSRAVRRAAIVGAARVRRFAGH